MSKQYQKNADGNLEGFADREPAEREYIVAVLPRERWDTYVNQVEACCPLATPDLAPVAIKLAGMCEAFFIMDLPLEQAVEVTHQWMDETKDEITKQYKVAMKEHMQ